jgi:hypothetical protein
MTRPNDHLRTEGARVPRPARRSLQKSAIITTVAHRWVDTGRLKQALRASGPTLLYGLRVWASVCLALYVAYRLELDNPFWAGTSAGLVCQPQVGASLRKGWFLMIGSTIGAVAIVVMTTCLPQERVLFLLSLTLWGQRALSSPRSCATSPPIRQRWPDIQRSLSPAISLAPPGA